MKPHSVKYIAALKKVNELALVGSADLSWWRDFLASEDIEPVDVDGKAQVLVTGLVSRWMGIPFIDLSVIVAAQGRSGLAERGYYLARGINTSRFLAGVERRCLRLPYRYRGDLHVDLDGTPTILLGGQTAADLDVEMGLREPSEESQPQQESGYTGALILPNASDRIRHRWFMVDIRGLTSEYAFDAARDRFEIGSECSDPVIAGLRASRFRGTTWHRRRNATHARSKTFRVRH